MKIYSFRDERNEFHHWYECRGEACDAARVHYNCNNEIAEVELHCDTEIEDISSNLFRVYVVIDNRTSAPVEAFLHANDAMHYCENSDDAYNMVKAAVQLAQQYPNVSDTYYVTIDHDKDDSTKFVTRFNAHPEHDGWCCAGKYYFPDRSWENPAVGPARVKILREKENYGFIVGEMVNPTLPEDLTETLNVIIRYMPDLDRVDVMKTSSGDTVIRTLKISNDYHRYEEYRYFAYVDDELIGSSIYGSDRSKTDAFVDYMSNQTCTLVKTIYNARTDKLQKLINMTMDEIDAIFDACKKAADKFVHRRYEALGGRVWFTTATNDNFEYVENLIYSNTDEGIDSDLLCLAVTRGLVSIKISSGTLSDQVSLGIALVLSDDMNAYANLIMDKTITVDQIPDLLREIAEQATKVNNATYERIAQMTRRGALRIAGLD